ncbi:MAG: hypothetical protein PHE49_05745 [bacterium]|nr:hypothetical protein [bacterium]
MGIIFFISALSLNFNPLENSYGYAKALETGCPALQDWIRDSYPAQLDNTNLIYSPKLSSIPGAFLYTSTSKGFNPTPELGAKIYLLEGLGATAGAVIIGGATLLAGGCLIALPLLAGDNAKTEIPFFIPLIIGAAALSGIPLGAVYGIKKVGNHYLQEGSERGALWGAIIGAVLTCGMYGLGVCISPSPETLGVSTMSKILICTSVFTFPVSTVIGYNYKHIFHK